MKHLFHTDDRDCCTFPKGYRFEWINVYEDDEGVFIEGKGWWGCLTWVKLNEKEGKRIKQLYEQAQKMKELE
jgi:hypothetical protein